MKHSKLYLVLIAILCVFIGIFTACSPNRTDSGNSGGKDSGNVNPPSGGTRIQMTFDGQTIYGTLDDNSVSRDLISRLPLTLDFSDYNGTEKIAYLPEGSASWDTSDAPTSCAPKEGDITMYSPWGNLAIFYHSFRQSNGLIPLGRLDDGEIDKLAAMNGSFSVTIALVKEIEETTSDLSFSLENGEYTVTGITNEVSSVIIPAEYNGIPVTKIQGLHGNGAFARKNIVSVVIPDSITEIGQNTFYACSALTTVTIGENSLLTTIGNNAFSGATSLTSIYIPQGVISIGSSAFNNCGGLNTITVAEENTVYSSDGNNLIEKSTNTLIRGSNSSIIPGGVKIIGTAAFRRSAIETIVIPSSVETIENYAFEDCENLVEITVSENNSSFASLDGILYCKDLTELLVAPDGLTGNVSLPSALKEIPMFAFDGKNKLENVFIPENSVDYIDNFAFRGITATIRYGGTKAEWEAIEKASEWGGDELTVTFDKTNTPDQPDVPEQPKGNKILVVYFSYSGNTKTVAEIIAEKSGATLVEIIAQIPYTAADTNYNDSSSRSQVERRNDARPEISEATYSAINMDEYSVVMIGYPIWNGYEPMIIRTFIEHYNGLLGKTVYTFSTSASSGGSTAFNSIKGRLPSADVKENLHFTRSSLSSAESTVEEKLTEWNLLKQSNETMRMKMSFNGQTIFVTLADNSATADLIARLKVAPITIEFSDFGGSEKIGYPSPALDVSNADGCDPVEGDLTIYTPWGNLAAFYKDTAGYSDSLVLVGKIEDNGIEILAAQSGTFTVTLELVV